MKLGYAPDSAIHLMITFAGHVYECWSPCCTAAPPPAFLEQCHHDDTSHSYLRRDQATCAFIPQMQIIFPRIPIAAHTPAWDTWVIPILPSSGGCHAPLGSLLSWHPEVVAAI